MYYSSWEEGRGGYLPVCQGVDDFGLHAVRYKVFGNWSGNKSYETLYIMTKRLDMRL